MTAAIACGEGDWPHEDWPTHDDPIGICFVTPPYDGVSSLHCQVVVLRSWEPVEDFARLLGAWGERVPPVLVVSPADDAETVATVFQLGATGYLVDGDYDIPILTKAVWGTANRLTHLSPGALAALTQTAAPPMPAHTSGGRLREKLSPRERQIMELLANGFGALEIGQSLSLAEKTVRNNLSNIYAKLRARGRTEAVLLWLGAMPHGGQRSGGC